MVDDMDQAMDLFEPGSTYRVELRSTARTPRRSVRQPCRHLPGTAPPRELAEADAAAGPLRSACRAAGAVTLQASRCAAVGLRELMAAQVVAMGELAASSAGAMLTLASAVAAPGSSPSKLLAALDVYVPVSEAFPVLARLFSWCPRIRSRSPSRPRWWTRPGAAAAGR